MTADYWKPGGLGGADVLTITPTVTTRPQPALLVFPQAGGRASDWLDPASPAGYRPRAQLLRHLADALGVVVVCHSSPADSLGNAAALAQARQLYAYSQTLPALVPGVRPGPVLALGASMGNATLQALARADGVITAAVAFFGLVDLARLLADPAWEAKVRAAHNLQPGQALPPGADPLANAAGMAGVDWRGWTGGLDALTPASAGTAYAAAIRAAGGRAEHTTVSGLGHDDAVIEAVGFGPVADHFRRHLEHP